MRDYKLDLLDKIEKSGDTTLCKYVEAYKLETNRNVRNLILFIIYKASADIRDVSIKFFDADASKNVTNSYKELYPFYSDAMVENQSYRGRDIGVKYELNRDGVMYRGDTMTSLWTSLKAYTKLVLGINSIELSDDWNDFIFRNRHNLNISDAFGKLLEVGHSLGNFIPVTLGFNVGRSNFGKSDYWDLTLNQIYLWYNTDGDEALQVLLNTEEAVENTKYWLSEFGTWDNFIKQNYMESFLEDNKPNLFYEGRYIKNGVPRTLEDFECFFESCSRMIEDRNNLMLKETGNKI